MLETEATMSTNSRRWFRGIRLRTVMMIVAMVALGVGYLIQSLRLAGLELQLRASLQSEMQSRYLAEQARAESLAALEKLRSESSKAAPEPASNSRGSP
jgi:hypothetical protein